MTEHGMPPHRKAVKRCAKYLIKMTKMNILKALFLFFLLLFYQRVICQKLDLKTLIEIYNGRSLSAGLNILQKIPGFNGTLSSGYDASDSSINGTINKDKFRATRRREKINMMIFFYEETIFQKLKVEAAKSLYLQETTSAVSMGVKRIHYDYSNIRKFKKGDLEIMITKCIPLDNSKVYFQLDVTEHR